MNRRGPRPPTRRSARAEDRPRGRRLNREHRSSWRALTSATRAGRISTNRATPAMPTPIPLPRQVAEANRRMRDAPVSDIHGPFIHAPRVGLGGRDLLLVGGMASGSAFVALACDAAGDHRSAAIARKVALGAVAPAPLLLIADLGRPERFLNMMRIFKPRSPMNTGSWCLVAFSGSSALAVGCDLIGRPKAARRLGAVTALLGSYLGSYTGVLLACTAVPLWSRSRTILGPAFVADRDRHRRGRHPPRTRGERPSARPPDAPGARYDRDRRDADRALALRPRRAAPGRRRQGAQPRAPRTSTSVPPRASSCSVSPSGSWRVALARANTNSRALCTSRPASCSGLPGSTQEEPPRGRRCRGGGGPPPAPAARGPRSQRNAAPCRPAAPRCRCRGLCAGPTVKRSGARASRSSGAGAAERRASGCTSSLRRRRQAPPTIPYKDDHMATPRGQAPPVRTRAKSGVRGHLLAVFACDGDLRLDPWLDRRPSARRGVGCPPGRGGPVMRSLAPRCAVSGRSRRRVACARRSRNP